MDIQYTASILTAKWWGSLLLIPEKREEFTGRLVILIDDKIRTDGQCKINCDYDLDENLLSVLHSCDIECSGILFSADNILPRKHFSLTSATSVERKAGYGNWLDDIEIPQEIQLAKPTPEAAKAMNELGITS